MSGAKFGIGLLLVLVSCEDNSREQGEACWEDADCVEPMTCPEGFCVEAPGGNSDGGGGHITCNDGTRSPSCSSCDAGCCSGHGGCD